MSDTPTISTDVLSRPTEYPCNEPGCDRVFASANSLHGHKLVHKPAVACPECSKMYRSNGALGNHRKNAHGIEGASWTARKARQSRMPKTAEFRADDLVQAAVTLLWPEGVLPVQAMVPLIQWRDATIEFLEKINSE